MPRITPNLWFDTEGEEAAEFYVSVFPNSKITTSPITTTPAPGRPAWCSRSTSCSTARTSPRSTAGPEFKFDEAISLLINCADQEEIDYYWEKLGEGGEQGPCGWLKDKYGLSWQVAPEGMEEVLNDPDPGRAERGMKAMLGMSKIDIAAIKAAADGV